MFTDTHCHILKEYYDDKNQIIKTASLNNINRMIVSGYDNISNLEVINDVNIYPAIYGTIGIHPNNVKTATLEDLNNIESNLDTKKIIALGEIGLDYHYDGHNKKKQLLYFEKQLEIAQRKNIPVVVHSRDATNNVINSLKKYNVKGVIHSFSDDLKTAFEYINLGFILGINGTITFKNSNLINIVKEIGIENIILETDSPYLTPVPFRGNKNEPKNVIHIAEFIAKNLDISLEKLSDVTNENIKKIFDI